MIDSKVSRRYAKALFSLGQQDGRYQDYGRDLQEFRHFCEAHAEFFQVISNRIFAVEERSKVLEFILAKGTSSGTVKNFLRLLLEKNRIGGVQQVADYFSKLTDEVSNVTRAEVITARSLKKEPLEKLQKALKKFAKREVKIKITEDRSLIGGLVIRLGDLVLDGSVKAQLEGLRGSLKH